MVPVILAGFCAMRALVDERRRPDPRVAAVRRRPGGLRDGRGRGRSCWSRSSSTRRARGADIYCEVVGYGVSNDAYHVATPHPDSIGVIEMMRAAIAALGHRPAEQIDYINAHGTGDAVQRPGRDAGDQDRVRRPRLRAGGVVEQVDDRAPLRRRRRDRGGGDRADDPPRRDPAHDQLPQPRPRVRPRLRARTTPARPTVRIALSNSMGLGGHNGCVILRALDE